MNYQKKLLMIGAVLLLVAIVFVVYALNTKQGGHSENLQNGWTRYEDTKLGFQIEYPTSAIGSTKEEPAEYIQVADKKTGGFQRLGAIIFSASKDSPALLAVTVDLYSFVTLDEWLAWQRKFYGDSAELAVKERLTIADQSAVIVQIRERGSVAIEEEYTVLVADGTFYSIRTRGLSDANLRHVWDSFELLAN